MLNFIDWVDTIDDYFEEMNTPEGLKCELGASRLNGTACSWWERLQDERFFQGKKLISSWPRMKNLLFNRFSRAGCSTKLPNQSNKEENEEELGHMMVDDLVHNKCSMKVPFQLNNIGQEQIEGCYSKDEFNYQSSVSGDTCKTVTYEDDQPDSLGHDATIDDKETQVGKTNEETEKGPNQQNQRVEEGMEVVKDTKTERVSHAKCSMKSPVKSSINIKEDEMSESDSKVAEFELERKVTFKNGGTLLIDASMLPCMSKRFWNTLINQDLKLPFESWSNIRLEEIACLFRVVVVLKFLLEDKRNMKSLIYGECMNLNYSITEIVSFLFDPGGVSNFGNFLSYSFGILLKCTMQRIDVATELLLIKCGKIIQGNGGWDSHMVLKDKVANRNALCLCSWVGNALDSLMLFVLVISLKSYYRIGSRRHEDLVRIVCGGSIYTKDKVIRKEMLGSSEPPDNLVYLSWINIMNTDILVMHGSTKVLFYVKEVDGIKEVSEMIDTYNGGLDFVKELDTHTLMYTFYNGGKYDVSLYWRRGRMKNECHPSCDRLLQTGTILRKAFQQYSMDQLNNLGMKLWKDKFYYHGFADLFTCVAFQFLLLKFSMLHARFMMFSFDPGINPHFLGTCGWEICSSYNSSILIESEIVNESVLLKSDESGKEPRFEATKSTNQVLSHPNNVQSFGFLNYLVNLQQFPSDLGEDSAGFLFQHETLQWDFLPWIYSMIHLLKLMTYCQICTGCCVFCLNITRGRVISWDGWDDENNSNKFVMTKQSVVTISICLSIFGKNGQLREPLKLFHKVVNGLDPPFEVDGKLMRSLNVDSYDFARGRAFCVGGLTDVGTS